jgi:hypothetical protein
LDIRKAHIREGFWPEGNQPAPPVAVAAPAESYFSREFKVSPELCKIRNPEHRNLQLWSPGRQPEINMFLGQVPFSAAFIPSSEGFDP